ncbi:DUF2071 domain-containing protein [Pedobacter sp. N36a]|uniref:YqjF family protein n=1 Tax=Pedobacter sp. N36a TaxID=2767996 RepID=UPI0016574866|nr:DUF2071 domain-containing protein [Pedobacter sp. N36a]MBC8988151.1 DUF2071 domain-containing protein [Pedobacter sp. N36a]
MSFLTAEWRKLAIANYAVDKALLYPYLPAGTEIDLFNGNCYVSLIGFLFKETRLLGIRVPFHANFEEVNLRFYVKYKEGEVWKRGVCFIKEIVPKFALTFIANTVYKENYQSMPMKHRFSETEKELSVEYQWKYKDKWQLFGVNSALTLSEIEEGSEAEFITEHYWGYAKLTDTVTNEYEVRHPRWMEYKVNSFNIAVDFELNYGKDFKFLNEKSPASVMLAEGSEITVERKNTLRFV